MVSRTKASTGVNIRCKDPIPITADTPDLANDRLNGTGWSGCSLEDEAQARHALVPNGYLTKSGIKASAVSP
jgi:hypothetical protein